MAKRLNESELDMVIGGANSGSEEPAPDPYEGRYAEATDDKSQPDRRGENNAGTDDVARQAASGFTVIPGLAELIRTGRWY